uniref:Uncharacterized protein n=1 Tax=Parastrongyloides trichosuri TaxID=131310 RepID=A0A0N4ZCR3_PARTI
MTYYPPNHQNEPCVVQYTNNPVILLPKNTNTITNSSIRGIMKSMTTDNIPSEKCILMPIPIGYNSPSFHIPRPVANLSKSNSVSFTHINRRPLYGPISFETVGQNLSSFNHPNKIYVHPDSFIKKEQHFRNTIGISNGGNFYQEHFIIPPSHPLKKTNNCQRSESERIENICIQNIQLDNCINDFDKDNLSPNKNSKNSPSGNSVIYDVPNFNVPPLLPVHTGATTTTNISKSSDSQSKKQSSTLPSYQSNCHLTGHYSNVPTMIAAKYFVPQMLHPSVMVNESKKQFKEILKNERKLKKYHKKLQRGLFKRMCCSSFMQLIWSILCIIGLGFLAYFILVYYLI